MVIDQFGRHIRYLRISLTDRCNLRCVYCMPEKMVFLPREELLTDEELIRLVRLFAELGFDKIRLTGGEPTVRPHLVELVTRMAAFPGIREISMTTNGLRLKALAEPLARAGLKRVNVSLDTLDPEKFRRITRWGHLEEVWEGILAAEAAGLTPIKLNAVVVRGYNDQDIPDLAALTLTRPWQVRFIEVMPFADVAPFAQQAIVSTAEMIQILEGEFGPLEPVNDGRLDGEARVYRIRGAVGSVGFISPVSEPFCAQCNRVRLTAEGRLRLCLLRDDEVDLREPLRAGASDEELKALIRAAIWRKPWGHGLPEGVIPMARVMSQIGG
ncbi:GTP 3',8-cyclase MoaA [Thermoflexus sp.]|uniref:GTP 3',8-cyclase MoaA n=1 Tax=Thermoflexus sp. TaxID=1969742 RepID=UPI0025D1439C|nr:GTP 3',8-cyclase MoaA [Thermoflexus sp.]MCS6964103.1 GTP 3',8-cyclase MoaA [Thermoflexus sp.]MCX7690159.1 GTP 3',8-cyclase MoaA [Thermoflexus sp.]MDW8064049.1 GTP 3',8-cyclase MoaA [Anaerolineae bacterium]MDW8185534.1 GTP 3',8-cyclase MoaA [Anaerolineae bacterium]